MVKEENIVLSVNLLILPILALSLLWGVYWLDWSEFLQLYRYGVYPRTLKGLQGVLFSPFLHGGIKHLYNNSIALVVLLVVLQVFYKKQVFSILFIGVLLSGLGTWLIARESYHIGASGLIYFLISFMFFKGIQSRYFRLIALSLLLVVLYGGMVWYMFPNSEEKISWEGHLSGFLTGFIATLFFKAPEYTQKTYKYEWQDPLYDAESDEFMKCFDDQGHFIIIPVEEKVEEWDSSYQNPFRSTLPLVVKFKNKEDG